MTPCTLASATKSSQPTRPPHQDNGDGNEQGHTRRPQDPLRRRATLRRPAASFLPLSSAVVSVTSLTCRRTAHERLCVSLLAPYNRSSAAETVQELAAIALTVARNSIRDAVWLATELGLGAGATAPTVDRDLLAQCRALYAHCFRDTTAAIALVTAAKYGDAKGAAAALRGYPERCEGLFYARGVKSPLQRTDKALQEELLASAEIVGLLR